MLPPVTHGRTPTVSFLTDNALTMHANTPIAHDQTKPPYKLVILDRYLFQLGVGADVTQETRRNSPDAVTTNKYSVHPSPAEAGTGGTALCTNRTHAVYAHNTTPRTLNASIRAGDGSIFVAARHAPRTAATSDTKASLWKEFNDGMRIHNIHNLAVLLDANADLADITHTRPAYRE